MSTVWTNWKLAMSLRWRVVAVIAAGLSMLWLMVAWAAQFDSWHYWLFGPALMWFAVLIWLTIAVCRLQYRFISRPLSFSLSGYRKSLRGVSFGAGLPAGLAGALFLVVALPYGLFEVLEEMWPRQLTPSNAADWPSLFLACSHRLSCPARLEACLRAAAGFAAGGAVALLALESRLVFSRFGRLVVLLVSVPLYFVAAPCLTAGIMFPLLIWPGLLLVSACIWVLIWKRLGDVTHLAQRHRTIIAEEVVRRERIGSRKKVSASIERPFRFAMGRCDSVPGRRHLWGSVFCAFGPALSGWKWYVMGLVFVVVIAGYNRWIAGALVFLTFALAVARIDLPAISDLLLPAGRRERSHATTVVVLGVSLLMAFIAICLVLLSRYVAPFMPHNRQYEYITLDFGAAFLLSLLVPWLISFRLLSYAVPGILRTSLRIGVGLLVVAIVMLSSPLGPWIGIPRPVLLSGVCLCGWVLFLLVLRHVCMRGCLVRNRMTGGD